jgi:hypothetical protein
MATNNEEDGGYYAIKGFEYQIDKAILEILNTSDENQKINIENIQDIDSESFVMQVKYKEQAKFSPSKIQAPVIQLINEFRNENTKKYYLYAFFGDLNGYDDFVDKNKKIDFKKLNEILGNSEETKKSNISDSEKNSFIEQFRLDFSPTFQEQFNQILNKLKADYKFKNDDEAILHYAWIEDFLRKLVLKYKKENSIQRSCTRKEVVELLQNGKKVIFNASFREYKGGKAYFKFIRDKYFSSHNVDNFERFFLIELSGNEEISAIKSIVLELKKFLVTYPIKCKSCPPSIRVTSGTPYIYFTNISQSNIKKLKLELISDGNILKDGYDYFNADFSLDSIIKPMSDKNRVDFKFLNNEVELKEVLNKSLGKTKEIYQFFISNPLEIKSDIKNIKIQIQSISDITSII